MEKIERNSKEVENSEETTIQGEPKNPEETLPNQRRMQGIWTGPEFIELVSEVEKVFGPGED